MFCSKCLIWAQGHPDGLKPTPRWCGRLCIGDPNIGRGVILLKMSHIPRVSEVASPQAMLPRPNTMVLMAASL